jgi:Dyp-type peroxidase family
VIQPGEVLLGYPNEYNKLPFSPTVAASDDSANLLRPDAEHPDRRDLGRNGTYLVFRKLRQDVVRFWQFCDEQTKNDDGTSNPEERTRLAAKMVGRWPSGAPARAVPRQRRLRSGRDAGRNNVFGFAETDPHGYRCPLGAHIRRSNPRDGLGPTPKESATIVNRHRLLRRGRPYGELMLDPLQESGDDGVDRGLVFICLNANIARQFEFVQQTWINDPKFHGLYDNKDPITGDNLDLSLGGPPDPEEDADIPYNFTIPQQPVRRRISGLTRFVHVRGGGYFFLPGLSALRFLAGEGAAKT